MGTLNQVIFKEVRVPNKLTDTDVARPKESIKKYPSRSTSEGGDGDPQPSFKWKVRAEGLEPSTNGLKGRCSTIELRSQARPILSPSPTSVNQLIP